MEAGAQLKGPVFVGAHCFVSATALLRGGVWLCEGCTAGPACELKSSWLGTGSKLAHMNFVGDSVIGRDVNFEAGSIVANSGALLAARTVVPRLALLDQELGARNA